MTKLEEIIVKAYEVLDEHPNNYIKGEMINALAALNSLNTFTAIEDAFALGFKQGLTAAKSDK